MSIFICISLAIFSLAAYLIKYIFNNKLKYSDEISDLLICGIETFFVCTTIKKSYLGALSIVLIVLFVIIIVFVYLNYEERTGLLFLALFILYSLNFLYWYTDELNNTINFIYSIITTYLIVILVQNNNPEESIDFKTNVCLFIIADTITNIVLSLLYGSNSMVVNLVYIFERRNLGIYVLLVSVIFTLLKLISVRIKTNKDEEDKDEDEELDDYLNPRFEKPAECNYETAYLSYILRSVEFTFDYSNSNKKPNLPDSLYLSINLKDDHNDYINNINKVVIDQANKQKDNSKIIKHRYLDVPNSIVNKDDEYIGLYLDLKDGKTVIHEDIFDEDK